MKKLIDNLDYMRTVYVPKNICRVRLFNCFCCNSLLESDIINGVKYIICRVCDDFKKCSQCKKKQLVSITLIIPVIKNYVINVHYQHVIGVVVK